MYKSSSTHCLEGKWKNYESLLVPYTFLEHVQVISTQFTILSKEKPWCSKTSIIVLYKRLIEQLIKLIKSSMVVFSLWLYNSSPYVSILPKGDWNWAPSNGCINNFISGSISLWDECDLDGWWALHIQWVWSADWGLEDDTYWSRHPLVRINKN